MSETVLAIGVFSAIVTLLSVTVLLIRRWLVAAKAITLRINNQREVLARSGETLLRTLANTQINLASACGGQGTCGQCRVVFENNIPALLPMELNLINKREEKNGTRLACMHKVYTDLTLRVPSSALSAGKLALIVCQRRLLSPTLLELTCKAEGGVPASFTAGGYLVIEAPSTCVDYASIKIEPRWESVWREAGYRSLHMEIPEPTERAYSLANAPQQDNQIQFVVRLALPPLGSEPSIPPGKVSSWLFSLQPDDYLTATGPYGNFHITENKSEIVCIGGGAGIAPLRSIIHDLLLRQHSKQKVSLWYGSRDRRELVYADEFLVLEREHPNFAYHPALSEARRADDWTGPTGFIHQVAETEYLATHPAPESVYYYLCGPPPMTEGALQMLERLGVPASSITVDNFGSNNQHITL